MANPYADFGFAEEDVVGSGLIDASALLTDLAAAPGPAPVPSPAASGSVTLAATGATPDVPLLAAAMLALLAGAAATAAHRRAARRG